jgi:NAD+ synthase
MWTSAVTTHLAKTGAELLIVPNGSPYEIEKLDVRHEIARARIRESGLPIVYVNQIGGQDELVFDGGSFVMTADGEIALEMPLWREQVEVSRWRRETDRWLCESSNRAERTSHLESVYQAIMIGLRDYVTKNKFKGVILGLSGGVDSALTAAVATDALGRDAVRCVMLPSKYTSQASLDDAAESAQLLGVTLDTVSIAPAVAAMDGMLAPLFNGLPPDLTEENVQSRLRGVVLMALSNKFGSMVVTTGNKSEVATGYATLYGDMCGGYSVLKDIYKTLVYDLCDWRNQHLPSGALGPAGRVVPQGIIVKPPSAELRPDQKDQDSLPPYEDLDAILRALMDQEISAEEVAAAGYPLDLVKRVQHLLFVAEYKRRQAAPGVKITRRNFGRDRRYPLTNGFRDVL